LPTGVALYAGGRLVDLRLPLRLTLRVHHPR